MTRTRLFTASLCLLTAATAGCAAMEPPRASEVARGPGAAPKGAPATGRAASADADGIEESVSPSAMAPSAMATAAPVVAGMDERGAAAPPAPPPPPRAAAPMVTGGFMKKELDHGVGASPTAKIAADLAPPPVQASASVKAGEWDDNANYREFQRWLGSEQGQAYHRADVTDRQFLVVRDADGKAVPRCTVTVADEGGHKVTLTTTASGRAILFPHAEGLSGKDFTASAACQNSTAGARFSLAQSDGVIDLKLAARRALPAMKSIDLAFILDTTGSMSEEITAVKATIQKVASAFNGNEAKVRIGLVEFKDRTDSFVTKVYPMTSDVAKFSHQVEAIQASGGGDTPESGCEGLHVGLNGLDWRGDAVVKMAFLIGDAPPHLDYPNDFDYAADMRDAAHRGIQVFTVAASGMDDLGQVVWRQIAQYTGATNLFVMRGGAGPQSTGAGDPKSSCGGTQTAFLSGNLDALIVRKVRRELGSLDRDPLKIAGLRVDENAKPCAERLMVAE